MRTAAGFVLAPWSDDRGVALADGGSELAAGVALVAEQRLAAAALAALKQHQRDLALVDFGRDELKRARGAIGRKDRVQPETPEETAVAGAVAVVGGVAERRAPDRFAAAGTLDRRAVDQQ